MPAWKKVVTSGSNAALQSLYVESAVTASIVSASQFIGMATSASNAISSSYFSENKTFGITIDGGGSAITTGVKGDLVVPFSGIVTGWYLVADQAGSIVIDVWKDTYANTPDSGDSIAGSEKPTLSSAIVNSDINLSSWTPTFSTADRFRFNVDSVSTVTRVTLILHART